MRNKSLTHSRALLFKFITRPCTACSIATTVTVKKKKKKRYSNEEDGPTYL